MADIKTRDAVKGTIKTIDKAAIVREHVPTEVAGLKFTYESGFLFMRLPSGRRLA